MKPCKQCSYAAMCITGDFEVIFNALALQHAQQWLATADVTKDVTRIERSARLVVQSVQKVLPTDCPELQPNYLIAVMMGVEGSGPSVDVVI